MAVGGKIRKKPLTGTKVATRRGKALYIERYRTIPYLLSQYPIPICIPLGSAGCLTDHGPWRSLLLQGPRQSAAKNDRPFSFRRRCSSCKEDLKAASYLRRQLSIQSMKSTNVHYKMSTRLMLSTISKYHRQDTKIPMLITTPLYSSDFPSHPPLITMKSDGEVDK